MLKKIGFSCAIFFAATHIACAETALPYFGAQLGYDTGTWKIKDVTSVSTSSNASGVFGGFFAGINWTVSPQVMMGTEIFGDGSSASTGNTRVNTSTGTSLVSLRLKYDYGFSVLPGIKFNDAAAVFLRLSILQGCFNMHQDNPPAGSTSNWKQRNTTGGQLGIGVQSALGSNWGVRGEYDYTGYSSFTTFGNSVSPHDNQFKIGIFYNFY